MFLFTGKRLKEHRSDVIKKLLKEKYEGRPVRATISFEKCHSLTCYSEELRSRGEICKNLCKPPDGCKKFSHKYFNNWVKFKRTIAIVGPTQIGKNLVLSNLLKKLLKRKKYEYVFYVKLNSFERTDKINILDFLTNNTPSNSLNNNKDEDLTGRVVSKLLRNKNVCIIFDQLEKSDCLNNIQLPQSKTNFKGKKHAEDFFTEILRRGFGKSQILVLLNPWHFYLLNKESFETPMKVIYVAGIDHKEQKQLVISSSLSDERCVKNNCIKDVCVGNIIKQHQVEKCSICEWCHFNNCHCEIQSLCYVPAQCNLLIEKYETLKSSSSIAVAAALLQVKVLNAVNKGCDPFSVGRFAWENYEKKIFVFDEEKLNDENYKLSAKDKNFFFRVLGENYLYTFSDKQELLFVFSHILLQELLAALWLLSRDIKVFENNIADGKQFLSNKRMSIIRGIMFEVCNKPMLKKSLGMFRIPEENKERVNEFPECFSCQN